MCCWIIWNGTARKLLREIRASVFARHLPSDYTGSFMRILLAFLALATASVSAQVSIGEVQSSDASVRGSVVLGSNGASIMSGSQITAGERNASLKLARGGDINV